MTIRFFGAREKANNEFVQIFFGKRKYDYFKFFLTGFLNGLARAIILCFLISLAACDSSNDENLSEWMAAVRRTSHTSPLSLPALLAMTPSVYEPLGRVDPFDASKISMLLDLSDRSGVHPDLKRSREPLES